MDYSYLGGIERGERQPTVTSLARIAAALDMPLGELIVRGERFVDVAGVIPSEGDTKQRPRSVPMPATQASPHSGTNIADARKRLGLTQALLAARVGVGRVTIARIETGVQSPTLPVALALAEALGMSVETLFGGDE